MDRMDQLIEKVVIEGAEFQIIQKPATLYAGYRAETDKGMKSRTSIHLNFSRLVIKI